MQIPLASMVYYTTDVIFNMKPYTYKKPFSPYSVFLHRYQSCSERRRGIAADPAFISIVPPTTTRQPQSARHDVCYHTPSHKSTFLKPADIYLCSF